MDDSVAGRDIALMLARGVRRALADQGYASLVEFRLASGRRVDIIAVDSHSTIMIVEIKSSRADYQADHKWQDYLDYCDAFYFAVPADFPVALVPESCGLMLADGYGATTVRPAPALRLNSARRRAVIRDLAVAACQRLHRLEDPPVVRPG